MLTPTSGGSGFQGIGVTVIVTQEMDGVPGAPIFFLSYAHPPVHVVELFEDLCTHVGQLVGSPTGGEAGFMDKSMGGGELWSDEVLAAAGTCHVFVALISTPYLKSPWCAREWDTFSRRPVHPRNQRDREDRGRHTAILQVSWLPLPRVGPGIPAEMSAIQRFSVHEPKAPEIERDYEHEGLYGLLAMRDQTAYRGTYQTLAWRLARSIVDTYHTYYVEPQIPDFGELRSSFRSGEG